MRIQTLYRVACFSLLLSGCSSVRTVAIRTGSLRLPPHSGAVALYAAGQSVAGTPLGFVQVTGARGEAAIETLLPLFVQKAAQIGGNAAVIDNVAARFEAVEHLQVETYSFPCGFTLCTGTRVYTAEDEVLIVTLRGRALLVGAQGGADRK